MHNHIKRGKQDERHMPHMIPIHSLRFRAECYRNIGANLYGGQS